MKARLWANGILSLLSLLGCVILFWGISRNLIRKEEASFFSYLLGFIILGISWVPNFIMGVITLVYEKYEKIKGLTIASGILAILGGLVGINSIISFIALLKLEEIKDEKLQK